MDPYSNGNWGEAAAASDVTLEPGLWSLDNLCVPAVLVATILNGKTFTWNSGISQRLTTRASTTTSNFQTTNNPTKTRSTLISPTTRHLIHLGTETTIGTPDSQDDMFIRFSDQEDINTFTPSDVTLEPGLWSLDNFGEVLVATILNGKTFTWGS